MPRRTKKRADTEAEIEEIRQRAAQLGLRLAGETLDARLPQSRCTPTEKARAQEAADAAKISLSEYIRRRACYP